MAEHQSEAALARAQRLADAYREMEASMCDLCDAGTLCAIAMNHIRDTGVTCEPGEITSKRREIDAVVFVVSADDMAAVHWAFDHFRKVAQDLSELYHAGFELKKPETGDAADG